MAFIGIEKTVWDALKPNKKAILCRMPENIDLMAETQIGVNIPPQWHNNGTHYYVFCHPGLTDRDAERMAKFVTKAGDKVVTVVDEGALAVASTEVVDLKALDAIALPAAPAVIFSSEIPPEGWEVNGNA